MRKERKELISPFAVLSVFVFIIIGIMYVITDLSADFADRVNGSISQGFRRIMAGFGDIFPFSLFEILVICSPLIIFFVVRQGIKRFNNREGRVRFIINLLAVVLLIYSGHILALGIAHNATALSKKMELDDVDVTAENLSEALLDLTDEINYLAPLVPRNEKGVFESGYSYATLSEKICKSYSVFSERYNLPRNYNSIAKGVTFGPAMSYLGITGIYTYVTGEANVNNTYPDYVTIFTTAHEMSHQRGILRENEANFAAYIVTASSDDICLNYSAAMYMYSYISSALYKADKDAYFEIRAGLCDEASADYKASSEVSEKYGDTIIEEISDWINDFYLQSSGSGGIVSYGRVVELLIAYRESEK